MPRKEKNEAEKPRLVEIAVGGKRYVEFIGHASKRMQTRDMTDEEVIKTLADPDEIKEAADGSDRKVAIRNHDAVNQAKVIFEELEDRIRVITAMWRKRRLSGR